VNRTAADDGDDPLSPQVKELGFPLTRLHDCPYMAPETVDVHAIFPLFDADPADPKNYRFAMTDDYIQSILDCGSQIVYRLGESIEHTTRRKYHIHPPRDFAKWAAICVNIIRHYNDGWAGLALIRASPNSVSSNIAGAPARPWISTHGTATPRTPSRSSTLIRNPASRPIDAVVAGYLGVASHPRVCHHAVGCSIC
jgi:hypothetical protein